MHNFISKEVAKGEDVREGGRDEGGRSGVREGGQEGVG